VHQDLIGANVVRVDEPGRTPLFVVVIGRMEIGRGVSGLLLADPEISRRHLTVESVGGTVVVSDLGSTNGTTVDGVRLTVPRVLGPGHVLRFGRCTLELSSVPVTGAADDRRTVGAAAPPQGTYRGAGG
jgi:pSer/pThr/pTyr-binding forkhead associated (FHA) protein